MTSRCIHGWVFSWFVRVGSIVLLSLVVSCSSPTDNNSNNNNTTPPKALEQPTGCHPLSEGMPQGGCMMPFPSTYYLVPDDKTNTKFRVSFPDKLPISDHGDEKYPLDPKVFNKRDGFSPATPILALFKKWVDPKTLSGTSNIAESVKPTSPVQLIEFGTQKRLPLFAEIDKNAGEGEGQVVIVRPMVRLKPKTRYAIVFLKSVKALDGSDPGVPEAYASLAAGEAPTTPEQARIAPSLQATWEEAKKAGLDTQNILYSWDFWTASDEPLLNEMIGMRDTMFKQVGEDGPEYEIRDVFNFSVEEKKNVMRMVQGVMKVPSFLTKDEPGGLVLRDNDGKPKVRGVGEFRFQVHIPRCVKDKKEPVPIMIFGHGLFGSAKGEMDSGYQRQLINRLCMVQIGNDWIGLSEADAGPVGVNVLSNFNNTPQITDRLQQAHVNAVAMIRMALRRLIKEKALEVDGRNPIDGKEIYYLGISNGAIQGGTMMALSPDIEKGILNVGAGNWSMMISRSSNFSALAVMLKTFHVNPVERQLIMALVQVHFDIVDPLTYAPYVLSDPQRFGVPPKKILIQEGIGDAQVPNLATRTWARTMGLDGVGPLFEKVFQIEEKPGPFTGSAYIQYGPRPDPYPADQNTPPKNNSTHEAVRRAESCMKQMEAFFKPNGTIQQFCEGPCDPN
ncbi:MAG: hypothetical protein EP343_03350 [Deltaproteobacteria bacterium]|nr:MAG: hypothetical protein EP343_03350 [Deltaproteobacteria bacterium]